MTKFIFIGLAMLLAVFVKVQMMPGAMIFAKLNGTAVFKLPEVFRYRRIINNAEEVDEEHLYRVCNGNNTEKCGFWENIETKQKVASGETTYDTKKKALIVKNMKAEDFGHYMTGNKKFSLCVMVHK